MRSWASPVCTESGFDVLTEQRRYLEVEQSFTDALRSAFEARTRLQLARGDLR